MVTILTEDGETIEMVGTKEELDERLISMGCGGYDTPQDFYDANWINFGAPPIEKLTIDQLMKRWI